MQPQKLPQIHRKTESADMYTYTSGKDKNKKSGNEEKYKKPAEKPSLSTNAELNAFKSDRQQ